VLGVLPGIVGALEANEAIKIILAHAHQPVLPPSRLRSEIPSDVEAIVLRCLAKNPADRLQTAAELRSALGLTVALVTHDLDTLVDLCDRIAVLADRRLVAIGTLDEVVACDHPFIQAYFHGHRGGRIVNKRQ